MYFCIFWINYAHLCKLGSFEKFNINLIEFYGVENMGVETKINFLS